MKVIVAIKCVATLDDEFDLLEGGARVDPAGLEFSLNEWDEFALEAALQLREQAGTGDVMVVTVGDEEADESLRSCLAKGADRALRIWDDELVEADPIAVARVLAAAIANEDADLILSGVQSSDAANGATGIALAGLLDLPRVAVVKRIEYSPAQSTLTVERELEGGLVEILRVGMPAVLTVQTGINQPRYANLRAIKQAREKPLTVATLEQIGLDRERVGAGAGSGSRGLSLRERGGEAEMIAGSPDEVAARVVAIIRERMAS